MSSYDWDEPLCLIENNDGDFMVNEDTLNKVKKITAPVNVVGIAGLYRTGKSYLMNKLARKHGFALGSTIQSKTKGIWCWCCPHPRNENICLILLDTEGLGDAEKGSAENDAWLFVLCVLLSSTLVYNSTGTIDQDAIDKIQFITELADRVKIKSSKGDVDDEEDGTDFDLFFPTFVWCVRDFTLEKIIDGREVSSDEYLEHVLKLKKGRAIDKKVQAYNMPRECIRTFFKTRKCYTFPRPALNTEDFKHLDTLPNNKLDPEFVKVCEQFLRYVFSESKVKNVQGLKMNGRTFAGLCNCYVDAIRNGAVPCIESALQMTAKIENANAVEQSVALYLQKMSKEVELPTESAAILSEVHALAESAAIELFLKLSLCDDDGNFHKEMKARTEVEYSKLLEENEAKSKRKCSQLLEELYDKVNQRHSNGDYAKPGGYQEYKQDMEQVVAAYQETPQKGVKSNEELNNFLINKQAEGSAILQADKKLEDGEKRAEEERKRAEANEQKRRAAEEESKLAKQKLDDQEKSFKESVTKLQEKFREDAKAAKEKSERDLENRMNEQQKLLQEGFKKKADEMKDEIDVLKKKHDEIKKLEEEVKAKDNKKWWDNVTAGLSTIVGTGLGAYFGLRNSNPVANLAEGALLLADVVPKKGAEGSNATPKMETEGNKATPKKSPKPDMEIDD